MARVVVVADASVLIALGQLDQLALLEKLFAEVLIPPAVQSEVAPGLPQLPAWVQTRTLRQPLDARVVDASLDPGETEAISLALETKAEQVILDDRPARHLAKSLGLAVVGTAARVSSSTGQGSMSPSPRRLRESSRISRPMASARS